MQPALLTSSCLLCKVGIVMRFLIKSNHYSYINQRNMLSLDDIPALSLKSFDDVRFIK
jgi:hypothetical protein